MISVILSTYNQPDWLEKVLWGYTCQTDKDFELVIADDGSGPETRERIEAFEKASGLKVKHVWHPDDGFQKSMILNKAVASASSDYLLFSDGDCIPRNDFVQIHRAGAERGYFLSGGAVRLSMDLSKAITREDIQSQRVFNADWLGARGVPKYPWAKHVPRGRMAALFNALTPTKATFNGGNASVWKQDFIAVNGYDERMQYGGQDRELGERLVNAGLKGKQLRYTAIILHLEHGRGYKTPETIQKNKTIRRATVQERRTWSEFGIVKEPGPKK